MDFFFILLLASCHIQDLPTRCKSNTTFSALLTWHIPQFGYPGPVTNTISSHTATSYLTKLLVLHSGLFCMSCGNYVIGRYVYGGKTSSHRSLKTADDFCFITMAISGSVHLLIFISPRWRGCRGVYFFYPRIRSVSCCILKRIAQLMINGCRPRFAAHEHKTAQKYQSTFKSTARPPNGAPLLLFWVKKIEAVGFNSDRIRRMRSLTVRITALSTSHASLF